MKHSKISIEAIVLIILLVFGLIGAKAVLTTEDESPGVALPRQESPAMVLVPDAQTHDYFEKNVE